ncbi:MAG TPA: hypothetical protein VI959_01705 [Alphaproteobacteria bacterium]|nr:hypothetical protein [Alphaproteobacteria bacterium]
MFIKRQNYTFESWDLSLTTQSEPLIRYEIGGRAKKSEKTIQKISAIFEFKPLFEFKDVKVSRQGYPSLDLYANREDICSGLEFDLLSVDLKNASLQNFTALSNQLVFTTVGRDVLFEGKEDLFPFAGRFKQTLALQDVKQLVVQLFTKNKQLITRVSVLNDWLEKGHFSTLNKAKILNKEITLHQWDRVLKLNPPRLD